VTACIAAVDEVGAGVGGVVGRGVVVGVAIVRVVRVQGECKVSWARAGERCGGRLMERWRDENEG
jgi:hypothetical protein